MNDKSKLMSLSPACSPADGVLPYTYTMDDPDDLEAIATNPTEGAGAGVLTWDKSNWLKTTYRK